ncbi:50S ribosomal protein L25/general stress protein Ctc [Wenzhouxiangella sp. XN201]|uniref:50S ribosomal protein L25/general stress protein Ctc n=1 Tax=Wenzhouxiangella sp. XN201 TaxID=2710755 RepID=UPI0013CD89DF|nr:50S ribosomal protein L25/general stress protein Ctc [Wenzhouxiangella sp. XN201]NEZ03419.1 50S ribosomal protein L25/general stress protein Ctc [Wenzhouxiangella sp. XN201]
MAKAKQTKIPAEMRTDVGKGASRRLRRAGRVPAVVYGGDREPASITIDHAFLLHEAETEAFHSSILELNVGKKKQKVVLRDLQRHPFKPLLTHADFLRVSDDHAIRMHVPIHFVGEEHSPAGKAAGVVISHQVVEVEIEALPKDLPEYLEVDLTNFEPGESVMLSEIPLPEGVIIPLLAHEGEEHDYAVVTAIYIRAGQGTGEMAAEADAAMAEASDVETIGEEEEAEAAEGEEGEGEEGEEGDDEKAEGEKSEDDDKSKKD